MKTTRTIVIAIIAIIIAACGTSKKSTTAVAPTAPSPAPTTPLVLMKPSNGIYAPGNEELTAIQMQHKEVTMDKLKEGYTLYTEGTCIKCHGAKNIYVYNEVSWKNIIDDMAIRAKMPDEQKDAVYMYVLAILATQPK
ncbi:MAG: hypothetical protein V4651_13090 [Bacteroidota bacterium]